AAVTQASAALPSLLAALGVVLSTFWIAWRLFGADAAAVAGLVSITMYGVLTLARAPIPDMTFCAELTAAMAAYVAAELGRRRAWLIAFYAMIGLAVWTKGPAGLLPLAVVLLDTIAAHGSAGPARLASAPGLLLVGDPSPRARRPEAPAARAALAGDYVRARGPLAPATNALLPPAVPRDRLADRRMGRRPDVASSEDGVRERLGRQCDRAQSLDR